VNTWTVRYTDTDGNPAELDPMTEDDAKSLLDDVRRSIDPCAVAADLLGELQARLPFGYRVRHVSTGEVGTVVDEDAFGAPVSNPPAGVRISHCICSRYEAVCVRFDARSYPLWIVADYFELVGETR
jgi:hypothetical protein